METVIKNKKKACHQDQVTTSCHFLFDNSVSKYKCTQLTFHKPLNCLTVKIFVVIHPNRQNLMAQYMHQCKSPVKPFIKKKLKIHRHSILFFWNKYKQLGYQFRFVLNCIKTQRHTSKSKLFIKTPQKVVHTQLIATTGLHRLPHLFDLHV